MTRSAIFRGIPGLALCTAAAVAMAVGVPAGTETTQLAAGAQPAPLSVSSPPSAASMADRVTTLRERAKDFADRSHPESAARTDALRDSVRRGDLPVRGIGVPDYERARAWSLDDGTRMLSVPLTGADLTARSNLTAFFDREGTLRTYTETEFTQLGDGAGHGRIWQDGQLRLDKLATDEGRVSDPGDLELVAKTTPSKAFKKFKACLNDSGVAAWEVALLGIACGAVCAATLALACPVCIAGAAVTAGAAIWLCAEEAGYV
jgi:hypothetical protein